jgi:hypothetical protein
MNKRIIRELGNRLAPLSAVAITFATITVVPAGTAMVAAASGTGADQTKTAWMDRAVPLGRDHYRRIGLGDDGHSFAAGYRVSALHVAARAPATEIR